MSLISLTQAKAYLDVIHSLDDDKLQMLLDSAEDEASQYIQRPLQDLLPEYNSEWPSEYASEVASELADIPASAKLGVLMLLQAAYQASPEDADKLRKGAEIKLTPFRVGWGI